MKKLLVCPFRGCQWHFVNWDGLVMHLERIHAIVARFWLKVGGVTVHVDLPAGGVYEPPNGLLQTRAPVRQG